MFFKLRLVPAAVAAVLVAACGGGSGSSSGESVGNAYRGVAVDGYLAGAKVVCDANENGLADNGETIVFTGPSGTSSVGQFVFPNGCAHSVLAMDGTNADTGLPFVGLGQAPANSAVISPLTTLLRLGMGQAQINAALMLPADTNVTTMDPAALSAAGTLVNPGLYKKTLAVQQLLQKTTETLVGAAGYSGSVAVNSVYSEVAAAFASGMVAAPQLLSSDTAVDVAALQSLVQAAAQRVAASASVDAKLTAKLAAVAPAVLAAVASPTYKLQADAILGASSTQSALASVVKTQQSDTKVAYFVTTNVARFGSSATTAQVNTLKAELSNTVAPVDDSAVLVNFDETPALNNAGFGGNQAFAGVVTLPTGMPSGASSGNVFQITRTDASKGGTTFDGGFSKTKVTMTGADTQTITALVYSPRAGVPMVMHLDNAALASNGPSAQVTSDKTSNEAVVQGWQTLTWTFSGLTTSKVYDMVVLTPDNGKVAPAGGENYYFDTLRFKASTDAGSSSSSGSSSNATTAIALVNFDETPALNNAGFGGNQVFAGVVDLPSGLSAGGSSGKVFQITRTDASKGGSTYDGGFSKTKASMTGADTQTITALVYAPRAGVPMLMHLDNAALATNGPSAQATADKAANEAVVQGWQTLSWTFSGLTASKVYDMVVLTPDNGKVAPAGGENYYFDNLQAKASGSSSGQQTATNYLALQDDSMRLVNGSKTTPFTLAQFQTSAGVSTSWPFSSSATLEFKLTEVGSFSLAAGQKLNAALEISETTTGKGVLQGYIQDVAVSKSGTSVTLSVPAAASSKMYGVTSSADKKAIVNFSSDVSGVNATLTADATGSNSLNVGNVLNYAITSLSNQFSGISALRGKYKVRLVISDLPLRQTNGAAFATQTLTVPSELNADSSVKTSVPVTGAGIEGYITLTD